MTLKLKRLGILSVAMFNGAIGVVIGLIVGLLYAALFMLGGLLGLSVDGSGAMRGAMAMITGLGVLLVFILPVLYGLTSFVAGAIVAAIFNLVAPRIGGIEMTFDHAEPVTVPPVAQPAE